VAAACAIGLDRITDPLAGFSPTGLVWQDVTVGEHCLRVAVTGPRAALVGDLAVTATEHGYHVAGTTRHAVRLADAVHIFGAVPRVLALPDPLARATAELATDIIRAPMPGLVKALFVAAGEGVSAGTPLAILEAMKMEHTLTAPRDGMVAEVLVDAGAQVEAGAALVRLAEQEE
jgi:3-methylcrotonyl-CoA carboxylase alpha subunit